MWAILGVGAIVCTALNILWRIQNKEGWLFAFFGLALTALTLCAFYGDAARRVINEDWVGLIDILPTMSKALWVCTIVSIIINAITYFYKRHN